MKRTLAYEMHGTGKIRIALVMGFMGTISDWGPIVDWLMKMDPTKYTLLLVDNRGAAASSNGLPALYTTAGMASDIDRVLEHVGWKTEFRSFHIAGISMGGMISLELAHILAPYVKSLTLMVTCAKYLQTPGQTPVAMGSTIKERAAAVLKAGCSDTAFLQRNDPAYPEFPTNYDRLMHRYMRRMKVNGEKNPGTNPYNLTLYGQLSAIMTHNVSATRLAYLAEMIPDILVLGGTADHIIDPSCSRYLEKMLNAKAAFFEGAGHQILDEREEESVALTVDIIDKGEKRCKTLKSAPTTRQNGRRDRQTCTIQHYAGQPIPVKEEEETEEQNQETNQREISGFYSISIGCEGYSAIGIAAFLPIVIQSLAAEVAFTRDNHAIPCNTTVSPYSCDVLINNLWVDTSALVLYSTSISVIIQFLLFISMGALADYVNMRKYFLIVFGIASAQVGFLILLVWQESLYWLACLIFIISNALYGLIWVFSYAYVPILTRFDPRVQKAVLDESVSQADLHIVSDKVANELSSKGFGYGCLSTVLQLVVWIAFVFFFNDGRKWGLPEVYPMQIAVSGVCFFQVFILLAYTLPRLETRPGPSLPKGHTYLGTSLSNLYKTLSHASRLSELFKFLIGWFIYSDSFTTVVSVAILFAQNTLGAPTTLILGGIILVPLSAGLGNFVWIRIQRSFDLSSKTTLLIQAALDSLLPLYGCIGFFTTSFGISSKYELLPLAAFHGFLLGATQSTCRVLYATLVPPTHESQFFALYELTDKGSAWIGPLIAAGLTSAFGTLRSSFVFLSIMYMLAIMLFASVDLDKGRKQATLFVETGWTLSRKKRKSVGTL